MLAEFGFGLGAPVPLNFHQLVNHAERGEVTRSGQFRAHSPNVNGRSLADKLGDAEFVQVAARDNLGFAEAVPVEDLPHLAALFEELAAVQPHPRDFAAETGCCLRSRERIVGINQ